MYIETGMFSGNDFDNYVGSDGSGSLWGFGLRSLKQQAKNNLI